MLKCRFVNTHCSLFCGSQVGLCAYLQHIHWFCENDVSHILFPRCYNVCQPDELTAFTHDFRITACLGLLKWLVRKYDSQGEPSLKSVDGKVQCKSISTLQLWKVTLINIMVAGKVITHQYVLNILMYYTVS
jgi:tubulin monoglycylase TTLL3/8